jgi:MtfA peptidase
MGYNPRMFGWLKRRRRRKLLAPPVPDDWRRIIGRNVWQVAHLTDAERATLDDRLRIFLGEMNIEGCGGLDLTDEVRVTVAAYACLLILHLDPESYDHVDSLLIYPQDYYAPQSSMTSGGLVPEGPSHRAGEAWMGGVVIVSWNDMVCRRVGHNVVVHEFAHQLDMLNRSVDGTPPLADGAQVEAWRELMHSEYEAMVKRVEDGRGTFFDRYAATNLAEFFAVASEVFFERPEKFSLKEPEMYRMFSEYYGLDLAERMENA